MRGKEAFEFLCKMNRGRRPSSATLVKWTVLSAERRFGAVFSIGPSSVSWKGIVPNDVINTRASNHVWPSTEQGGLLLCVVNEWLLQMTCSLYEHELTRMRSRDQYGEFSNSYPNPATPSLHHPRSTLLPALHLNFVLA